METRAFVFASDKGIDMKEHYKSTAKYGTILVYKCDHPLYTACSLFKYKDVGLAVIQQRFNRVTKHTWWGPVDPLLITDILANDRLESYLSEHARKPDGDMYPTVTIRQLMWALRMKPLTKDIWETRFF